MVYLPVYIEDGSKLGINLGIAYRSLEECLDFIFDLGYVNRVIEEDRMIYSNEDNSRVEVSIVEMR